MTAWSLQHPGRAIPRFGRDAFGVRRRATASAQALEPRAPRSRMVANGITTARSPGCGRLVRHTARVTSSSSKLLVRCDAMCSRRTSSQAQKLETWQAGRYLGVDSWLGPGGGFVLISDTRFGVAPRRGRKPDVSVYFAGRKPPAHGLVTTPPDIMIEIVSPRPKDARRDRVEKTNEYAAFGVRFYWIVDPALRSLEIFELGTDGRYVKALGAASGIVDPVPGCKGLTVNLDALWDEANRLEAHDEE
ncbi:MAG: Uma2 family endonuclease [Byssovorax sp.]